MTSKNLYFNLMKEDLKRRLWNIALVMLAFFFCLPVAMLFVMGADYSGMETAKALSHRMMEATWILSASYGWLISLMILLSVVCGISGFSYLHSRKKINFYHSIPVKRQVLFWVNFINGILIVAVFYGINLILACVIAGAYEVSMGALLQTAAISYLFHMVYFILMYAVAVIAMMMTGHLAVGILGVSQFFVYGIAAAGTILNCFTWFETYTFLSSDFLTELMYRLSPAAAYIHSSNILEDHYVPGEILGAMILPAAFVVIFTLTALWLYKKRPSEAAGKAMVFPVSMAPIRCLITVLCGIGGALAFWELRHTTGWAVFGLLCGSIIAHCVIEVIYHFDFKKLFSHKFQMAGCIVVSLLVFGCFRYDWMGYDTYLPDPGAVESVGIYVGEDIHNDRFWKGESEEGRGGYIWHADGLEQILETSQVKDLGTVFSMASDCIREVQLQKEKVAMAGRTSTITFCYHMKNGKEVYRSYHVPLEAVEDEIGILHQDQDYQNSIYPILTVPEDEIVSARYEDATGAVADMDSEADAKALLLAYKADVRTLTLEEEKTQMPVATIKWLTKELKAQMEEEMEQENHRSQKYEEAQKYQYAGTYPVYASFVNTLEVLRSLGADPEKNKEDLEIISYTVTAYDDFYEKASEGLELPEAAAETYESFGEQTVSITESEKIAQLKAVVQMDIPEFYPDWYEAEPLDITARTADEKIIRCLISEGEVPQWLEQELVQAE